VDLLTHFQGARNVVSVPAGGVLFAEGDPATNMYILLEGQADICVGGDVVESALPPALLGEMALIDRSTRSATVVSRGNCKLVSIDTKQFDLLVRESPEFARQVMSVMANRLRAMNERLREAIGELSVRGRRPR
jgi:CRP/FNR family transcriptional regulator, cyclic AMP receptor protein